MGDYLCDAARDALRGHLLALRERMRASLAADPRARLDELFSLYVERQVVPREHREHVLERSVRSLLRTARLGDRFVSATVGNDEYHARFPFVQLAPDEHERQPRRGQQVLHRPRRQEVDAERLHVERFGVGDLRPGDELHRRACGLQRLDAGIEVVEAAVLLLHDVIPVCSSQ